jgi:hypothetical protein
MTPMSMLERIRPKSFAVGRASGIRGCNWCVSNPSPGSGRDQAPPDSRLADQNQPSDVRAGLKKKSSLPGKSNVVSLAGA